MPNTLVKTFQERKWNLKTPRRQPDIAGKRNNIVIVIMMKLELLEEPFN